MKYILLVSAFSSLSLPLITAVAIPQAASITAAADMETTADVAPGKSSHFAHADHSKTFKM